jgi:hypothetical protein
MRSSEASHPGSGIEKPPLVGNLRSARRRSLSSASDDDGFKARDARAAQIRLTECVEQVTLPSELAPGGFRASRGHHSSRQNRHNVISRWLQPYPDVLLEGIADPTPGSEARYSQSQAIQWPLIVLSLAADHIAALTRFHVTISIRNCDCPPLSRPARLQEIVDHN